MRHLDLFSGIGGFAFAADYVWPGIEHTFCEIDPFCRAVLNKHWPHSRIYVNIRNPKTNWKAIGPVDLLTAGVPCQPASAAGKQKGTADNRWLWPETLALIAGVRPRYAILENVPGLLSIDGGLAFEDILAFLDEQDYETIPLNLPAAGVGAPHLRERIWLVAHDTRRGIQGGRVSGERRKDKQDAHAHGKAAKFADSQSARLSRSGKIGSKTFAGSTCRRGSTDDNSFASDTQCIGCTAGTRHQCIRSQESQSKRAHDRKAGAVAPHTVGKAIRKQSVAEQGRSSATFRGGFDREEWIQAVARLCVVDDGLPRKMVRLPDGSKISAQKWRNESIKGAGNAIVPQVAAQIMRFIKEIDL